MIQCIENTKEWKEYLDSNGENLELLSEALRKAFVDIDALLLVSQNNSNGTDVSGCTSVTVMITPTHIVCANAGDSRSVLGVGDGVFAMSEDHKPSDEKERQRIENAGGHVQWKRVNGDLAVSRAFGDFQYKNRDDLPPQDQKVSCCPDITIQERAPSDDVLILACDGLWDVMTNDEAIALLREIFQSGESSMGLVAEEMVDIALMKGSKDNISAVVVKLPGANIGPASNGGVTKRREQRERQQDQNQGQVNEGDSQDFK
jgi:serine/threonine protein phosphatase PrpC